MKLGDRLKKLRLEKGYSQDELAREMDVSRQVISKWERNNSIPDGENIRKMTEIFKISSSYLLMGEEEGVKNKLAGGKLGNWIYFIGFLISLQVFLIFLPINLKIERLEGSLFRVSDKFYIMIGLGIVTQLVGIFLGLRGRELETGDRKKLIYLWTLTPFIVASLSLLTYNFVGTRLIEPELLERARKIRPIVFMSGNEGSLLRLDMQRRFLSLLISVLICATVSYMMKKGKEVD